MDFGQLPKFSKNGMLIFDLFIKYPVIKAPTTIDPVIGSINPYTEVDLKKNKQFQKMNDLYLVYSMMQINLKCMNQTMIYIYMYKNKKNNIQKT